MFFFSHLAFFVLMLITAVCDAKKASEIIGGTTTSIAEYPYIVSIQWLNIHYCSGTLISSSFVLTTATCVSFEAGTFVTNFQVLAGTNDKLNTFRNAKIRNVIYIILHYNYVPYNFWENDVAILKLDRPFNMHTISIQKIAVSTSQKLFVMYYKTAGWGDTTIPHFQITQYLQKIKLKNINKQVCHTIFGQGLSPFQSCAKVIYPNQELSMGDSGNPMIIDNELVGVISAYSRVKGKFIIFTEIWNYNNWIRGVMAVF